MANAPSDGYSVRKLLYCAGVVVLVYWLPFAYLVKYDPNDDGRGGLALCISIVIAIPAYLVGTVELVGALRHFRRSGPPPPVLALVLYALIISPLLLFAFRMLGASG